MPAWDSGPTAYADSRPCWATPCRSVILSICDMGRRKRSVWQRWTEQQMRELVDYSRQQKVGLWFWKHSKDLRTAAARESFFAQLQRVGVVGAKIDFFDHEAKEIIDLYQALLRTSAEHRVM